jgi:hypothetical protein
MITSRAFVIWLLPRERDQVQTAVQEGLLKSMRERPGMRCPARCAATISGVGGRHSWRFSAIGMGKCFAWRARLAPITPACGRWPPGCGARESGHPKFQSAVRILSA